MNQFPIYFLLASSFILMAIIPQNGANAAPSASFLELFGKKNNDARQCEQCKQEIADMDYNIQQIGTFVEAYLLKVLCPMMAPHEKECQDFVKNNLTDIFTQLHELLANPEEICQAMKLCPEKEGRIVGEKTVASKLVGLVKMLKAKIGGKNGKNECQECVNEISQYDELMMAFGPELIKFIDEKICPMAPEEKKCKEEVAKWKELMGKTHEMFKNPKEFCRAIGYC